jgi:hypothetical protein
MKSYLERKGEGRKAHRGGAMMTPTKFRNRPPMRTKEFSQIPRSQHSRYLNEYGRTFSGEKSEQQTKPQRWAK